MRGFDNLSLYMTRLDWRTLPRQSLCTAAWLTSCLHHTTRARVRNARGKISMLDFEKLPARRVIRLAGGDPALLLTWKARCHYTQMAVQPAGYDIRDGTAFQQRWRVRVRRWIREAQHDLHQQVMLHTVFEWMMSTPFWSLDDTVAAFPAFYQTVYDPVIALTVMDAYFASRLLHPDPELVPQHALASGTTIRGLLRTWAECRYGLDPDDSCDHRALLLHIRRLRQAGDYLLLDVLTAQRPRLPQAAQDPWVYRRWLHELPAFKDPERLNGNRLRAALAIATSPGRREVDTAGGGNSHVLVSPAHCRKTRVARRAGRRPADP